MSVLLLAESRSGAQTEVPGDAESTDALRQRLVKEGVSFLLTKGQHEDGSFHKEADPGVSALCVAALLRGGQSPSVPGVERGLKYLESFVRPDGGIYREGSYYQNYETCISVIAFHEANRDGRYQQILDRALAYARELQWDQGEGKDATDPAYGGAGYGSHKRPDLSNTQFLIDALKAEENDANREAITRALIFVSRAQNLVSEHNRLEFPGKNPDGGFYYTPAAGGSSQAGETDTGGLRSYGSMTYAGLKSLIYAGVGPEDERVKAALGWIRHHYTLQENPGMGTSGLYYYFHTFAKALEATGQATFTDDAGTPHAWRTELIEELARLQQADGSWNNSDPRWLENDPNLVTAYALLALSHCD
ncbi:MAG TPA: prenyltransferase/squalene oxidase repeat-containing protein [Pirellulaceae bacterium]